jgi:hypothetical protein
VLLQEKGKIAKKYTLSFSRVKLEVLNSNQKTGYCRNASERCSDHYNYCQKKEIRSLNAWAGLVSSKTWNITYWQWPTFLEVPFLGVRNINCLEQVWNILVLSFAILVLKRIRSVEKTWHEKWCVSVRVTADAAQPLMMTYLRRSKWCRHRCCYANKSRWNVQIGHSGIEINMRTSSNHGW